MPRTLIAHIQFHLFIQLMIVDCRQSFSVYCVTQAAVASEVPQTLIHCNIIELYCILLFALSRHLSCSGCDYTHACYYSFLSTWRGAQSPDKPEVKILTVVASICVRSICSSALHFRQQQQKTDRCGAGVSPHTVYCAWIA